MNTKVTARHFELTENIKIQAEENFESLQRYYDQIIACDLVLNIEKHRKMAELRIKVYNQTLTSTEESDNMRVSIESVFDKARGQLKKYKGKLKHKNPKRISSAQTDAAKPDTDVDSVDY
ncbi:MAG: ribosome-associated translation inhibitor RaiA [FCB group bacterium]|nr:ribosome-associated translation inhibitor RaiA [FCB group bacterium]